jgi:ABC-2 type transport system ATP-binding protein
MEEADQLCDRVAIMDHGRILALDTPAALKQTVGADTIVTVKSSADPDALSGILERDLEGVTRIRKLDGGVEIHMRSGDSILVRVINTIDRAGFDIADLSIAESSLETVFINLTGKELRD